MTSPPHMQSLRRRVLLTSPLNIGARCAVSRGREDPSPAAIAVASNLGSQTHGIQNSMPKLYGPKTDHNIQVVYQKQLPNLEIIL